MSILRSKTNKDDKLQTNIGVYLFLNTVILLVFALVIRIYFVDNTKTLVAEKYSSILTANIGSVEKDIKSIIGNVQHLKDSDFDSCMSYTASGLPQTSEISKTISSFQEFADSYEIIDNIVIMNYSLNMAVSNDGKYELDEFLEKTYKYTDYSLAYWKSYKTPLYHVQMLPPSIVNSESETKTVIPIVFSSVKDTVSSNHLVVNISADKIFKQSEITKNLTKNSRFYIVSNYNKTVFHSDDIPSPDEKFVEYIKKTKAVNNSPYVTYKDSKTGDNLFIRYAPTSHILGYEYIIMMPINDIPDIKNIKRISNFIMFIIMAMIIGWIIMGKRKIIEPVVEIESSAKKYKQEADTMLPIVREKYVSDIINSPLSYIDGSVSEILSKSKFAFKHDNFIAVIIRYNVDKQHLNTLADVKQGNLVSELNLELKVLLNKKYDTVNICINDESLYVISLENSEEKEDVIAQVNDFLKRHTSDAITFTTGISEVYSGHIGIKKCVETANYDLLKCITPDEVKKNANQSGKKKYTYSKQDDDKLFNLLVAGYADETMKLVSEIIRTNIQSGVSDATLKELYRHILNTLTRVMDMKNIEYSTDNDHSPIDFIVKLLEKESDEIYKYIMNCINQISAQTKKYNTKLDFSKIIRYIDEHYAEDLSLDIIALHFGTSSKYLSRKLKQHLGMNFHNYLTQIRVNHAKILLASTNMKIDEIGHSVGYMSNTTFVRAFKSETGLSPAAYKKQEKQ